MAETRKLAAILAADVAGYSKLAAADEERTLARLRALRSELFDPTIALHHGRVVKRTGDGVLIEFRSVVEAVRCAIEVQNGMVERNAGLPPRKPEKMKRKAYEAELHELQVQLCHLQEWVRQKGLRVIIVFEGRDAAGKGGTIKAIAERVSPRIFRVIALPAPSDRQKTQMFMQRYVERFPAAGEVIIFDRSWYNRAGVEYVMGFTSDTDTSAFSNCAPRSNNTSSMAVSS
jgi:Polyphosphate kinase 2 (PPK2)